MAYKFCLKSVQSTTKKPQICHVSDLEIYEGKQIYNIFQILLFHWKYILEDILH